MQPGDRGGERVLCLHGFQDNCASFDRLIPRLNRRHEYLCFDWPNHGLSSSTPLGVRWTLEHYMVTVKRVMSHVWPQWSFFVCVGHSMGGQVGKFLAAVYPDAVKKLVLLDSVGPLHVYPEDVVPVMRRALDDLLKLEDRAAGAAVLCDNQATALARIKRRFYGLLIESGETLTDKAARTLMTRYYRPQAGGKYVAANDARLRVTYNGLYSAAQHRDVVEHIRCPTLWIRATVSDTYYKDAYALFVKLYGGNPNFRTVTVQGNHDVHMNHPHMVAPIVNEFLDGSCNRCLSKLWRTSWMRQQATESYKLGIWGWTVLKNLWWCWDPERYRCQALQP